MKKIAIEFIENSKGQASLCARYHKYYKIPSLKKSKCDRRNLPSSVRHCGPESPLPDGRLRVGNAPEDKDGRSVHAQGRAPQRPLVQIHSLRQHIVREEEEEGDDDDEEHVEAAE